MRSEQEALDIDSGKALSLDRATLESQMPAGTGTGGGNPAAAEIKTLIATLESLLEERAKLKDVCVINFTQITFHTFILTIPTVLYGNVT